MINAQQREGTRVPEVTFRTRENGAWKNVTSSQLFGGRTVVLFGLPGAFTPTCSSAHVPRYNELADAFAAAGVDEIVCLSVNDAFVMDAWKIDQKADRVTFLPDGNGEFSAGMGLLVGKEDLGFGARSWRYSMLVRDGVIEKLFLETERPGDPFDVSDADTMLAYLKGTAPPDILMITRPGCVHCHRAKELLRAHKLPYAELPSSPRTLRALGGPRTTPRVFINGEAVGGADELEAWLKRTR